MIFSRNLIKTNEKSIKMTPRSVPKRPKMLPRRLQDGLEAMFFSHRFLSSILIRFGSDLGAMLEPFWEPKSIIFGIDFWMIFHVVPGTPQERPRASQERPKSSQEPPKSGPRAAQERPRAAQERLGGAKIGVFPYVLRCFVKITFLEKMTS